MEQNAEAQQQNTEAQHGLGLHLGYFGESVSGLRTLKTRLRAFETRLQTLETGLWSLESALQGFGGCPGDSDPVLRMRLPRPILAISDVGFGHI